MDLIWRLLTYLKFGVDLIWRMVNYLKFGEYLIWRILSKFAKLAKFVHAKFCTLKVHHRNSNSVTIADEHKTHNYIQ